MHIDLIGYAAGGITAVCFVPQIAKTLKTGHAEDLSYGMLIMTIVSAALYEVYALLLELWPVVFMNGIFLVLVGFELGLKIILGKKSVPENDTGGKR